MEANPKMDKISSKLVIDLSSIKKNWEEYWKQSDSIEKTGTFLGNFLRSKRLKLIKKAVKDIPRSYSVLDMGCGGGRTLQLFSELNFKNPIGIDFSQNAIKRCKELGYTVHHMDAKYTSLPNNSFDIVFEEGLWEHFSEPLPYVYECTRISRKFIIVVQPNHFTLFGRLMNIGWNFFTKNSGGVKEYSFPLSYFIHFLKYYNFNLLKSYHTPLHEQDIMIFEKNSSWKIAQQLELNYVKSTEDKTWKIPYSATYWADFLYLNDVKGQGVEICCGNHGAYNFFENIIGLDPINFHNHNFIKAVGEHLPIKPIDFIICCNGIDHCNDPKIVLSEMIFFSKKIILWIYVYPHLISWFLQKTDKMHPHHLTKSSLKTLLKNFSLKTTVKKVYTPFYHWKYTSNKKIRIKLLFAYFLGVRGLCLHLEVE